MPAAPDFRLYHSNALDVLAGLLATEIARPPADGDLLRPDIVLVPQFSMRRWLQQALAEQSGICANLKFLTPGEYVELALTANLGPAGEADRLAPEVLRWHLLRELHARPPADLARFLVDGDARKAWSLANALAETYEKYQAWRRDWLLAWERGANRGAGSGDWQAELWRRVARGRAHRARRLDDYLRRFGSDGSDGNAAPPSGLPPRLFVFACQNVSPDVLRLIASQARTGTQHFYMHTPARAYWGDLSRYGADYAPAADDAFLGSARPNPLLAAWGQAGRDFVATLGSGELVRPAFELVPFAEPSRDSLLGRMQADVLENTEFAPSANEAAWPREAVDRADTSLQFHACHTRLREVQVLHDQLRALLEAPGSAGQPPLQPRDIAVLAPDIDAYAPHVEAVFGGALGSARELPYTIADTSPLASAPLAEAFLRLLEAPLHPLGVGDVVDLLAVPAVAARFGVDEAARGALQDWLESAGARWGLDAVDRKQAQADGGDAYTLEFALDRLLLGYATGSDADIEGDADRLLAPWPELEGQASQALDALLQLLMLLRDARSRLAVAQPPSQWQQTLETLLDRAFAPERDSVDAAVLKRLRQAIATFAQGAQHAGFDAPVEHAIVLEQLRAELSSADARAPFLSGGVCFGRMVPMRLIPFKVICLLGLDEGAFPARDARDPLNRIAAALDTRDRRTGDPSRRDADRYLFLQLFASAGRVLYLSWCGMDARDNSRREPSAVVSELLEAASRYHVAGDERRLESARNDLVVRHALQPFAPAAFGALHEAEAAPADRMAEPRRFSFDARWHPAADAAPGTAEAPVFAPSPLRLPLRGAEQEPFVGLDRLRRTLMRPHAVYLRDGLGLRLPEDEPPLPEHEPLGAPDALENYTLRHAVFDAWLRRRARPDARALHARLLARALVAPGADGRATVAGLIDEMAEFAQVALAAGFGAEGRRESFQADCGAYGITGAIDGVQEGRVLRVVLNPGGVHGGHAVRHGLDHLCASLLGFELHELAVPEKDALPEISPRPELKPAKAKALLDSLLAVREEALRTPLVFLPKAGYRYVRTRAEKDHEAAMKLAREGWTGQGWQADRAEAGEATALALRGRDPFDDAVDEATRAAAQKQFAATASAIFAALEGEAPVDIEALR